MFNRLLRCISAAKIPGIQFPLKPQPITRHRNLLMKRTLCSAVVAKAPEPVSQTPDEMAENELKSMIESDPAVEKRYKILQLEVDVLRHAGKAVPDNLKAHHWVQLLKSETRSQRKRYLQFLFLTERKQENYKKKKEQKRLEREKLKELEPKEEESDYGLHRITMFMRIYDTTMHQFYHTRLLQAMMFGPKLIIDCGYYAEMTPRECNECAKQLAYMFAQNRVHPQPFDLHFCNANKSSVVMQKLHRIMPPLYDADFPLNISEESYTEIFDKDKLVYLTPDCNNEMKDFDPDSLYIIGGIVDKTNTQPLSLAKAKKEGLRMAKLPLNKYLLWGSGSGKRLALNHMVNILTDLRVTGDWQTALKHVPKRKLEKSIDYSNSNFGRKERYENENDGPFRPHEENKPRNSFSFKDRQKRTFSK